MGRRRIIPRCPRQIHDLDVILPLNEAVDGAHGYAPPSFRSGIALPKPALPVRKPALLIRLAALGLLLAGAPAAVAQSAYCDRLRADMAALDQGQGRSQNQPYADSIRRQKADLDRTVAYARSIGCQRQRFIFFGDSAPPQCAQLSAQIDRLESNLSAMQDQMQRSSGQIDAQRQAMAAAYDAQCRGAPQQARTPAQNQPGFIERLFGVVPEQDPYEQPDVMEEPSAPVDPLGAGAYKTLCVRKCDGYYFPISPRSTRARFETDASLCQASCPNAEVELFLQPLGQEADAAVAMDGTPYSSLPNAFRYRKAVDPGCSCKAPGASWVDTLADAERLIGERSQDVVVTEQKAQELSRAPAPASSAKPPPAGKAAKGKPGVATAAAPRAPLSPAVAAAQVPTAGSESSGIGGSGTTRDKTVAEGQGETRTVATPQGKKTVRIVAPTLGPAVQQTQ
jgi:hypothetical protein